MQVCASAGVANTYYMLRTKEELRIAPTESNWNTGEVHHQLQKDYHNQRRHAKRGRFDWKEYNKQTEKVFRDT